MPTSSRGIAKCSTTTASRWTRDQEESGLPGERGLGLSVRMIGQRERSKVGVFQAERKGWKPWTMHREEVTVPALLHQAGRLFQSNHERLSITGWKPTDLHSLR